MSTVKFISALHCQPHDRSKVIAKGQSVSAGMVAPKFPAAIPYTGAQIAIETGILVTLNGKVTHGSEFDTQKANEQSEKVYNMLHDCMPYVDSVALGVKSVIMESGYDANEEPVDKPIPNQPVIKKVEDGKVEHSAKIKMAECEPGAMHIVETRIKNDPSSVFTFAMQSTNSHALVLTGLTRGIEIEIRVKDQNSAGVGVPSDPYTFMPR